MITDAISSQKWPGEAKVHVSLVNWVKASDAETLTLDGVEVSGIDSSLHVNTPGAWTPATFPGNKGRCFQGPIPVGGGFIITEAEAKSMLGLNQPDYREVIRPYLTSEDIAELPNSSPSRWVIDFGSGTLEAASRYPAALALVRVRVKPERDANNDSGFRQYWWRFGRPRIEMREALTPLRHYVATGRHGKRFLADRVQPWTMASDATCVFAFDDDFSMGVLQSRAHIAWAWAQASTLKGDLRYTPTSVFMTFPWAGAFGTDVQREAVAEACRRLLTRRSEICQAEQIGLTKLYNAMDDGAWADLKRLHQQLDESVAACYGWPRAVAQDNAEIVRRLTALNKEITEGRRPYDPFGAADDPT